MLSFSNKCKGKATKKLTKDKLQFDINFMSSGDNLLDRAYLCDIFDKLDALTIISKRKIIPSYLLPLTKCLHSKKSLCLYYKIALKGSGEKILLARG